MLSRNSPNPWNIEVNSPNTVLRDLSNDDSSKSEDEDDEFIYPGNYSTHMNELFDGEAMAEDGAEEDEDEDVFVYTGVDSGEPSSYKDQLHNVLDQDHGETESDSEIHAVETSFVRADESAAEDLQYDPPSPPISVHEIRLPGSNFSTPNSQRSIYKPARPFLHPTVSRLRSYTPQSSRIASNESSTTSHSHVFDGFSPSPSQISTLSRVSSSTNLISSSKQDDFLLVDPAHSENTVFKWADLQQISQTVYSKASQKVSHVLGTPILGVPTVLAANGFICIGTTEGKVAVHDFRQTLICVCENTALGNAVGAVTALALSDDHTFVASGHATGHILLYNLKQPHNPVRSVPPTTLMAVSSGRKEGHIQGSKIVSIGFVAGRHTALVSADENGLAFYHSLGKILFVEASDILRILGRYPVAPYSSLSPTSDVVQRKPRYTVLGMAPLPLGTAPHATDVYNLVALLTPTKLVVVGLKPTPRTWFKCPRKVDEGGSWKSKSKNTGTLAWFPSVIKSSTNVESTHSDPQTSPLLAYSWGNSLNFISVTEERNKRVVTNSKTGKMDEIDVGIVSYTQSKKWFANGDILGMQWLNHHQLVIVTPNQLGVFDTLSRLLIEAIAFDGHSLISPTPHPMDKEVPDIVAHSIRAYKGKIFILKKDKLTVGTLMTWADRILSLVEGGDFLKAIELARSYYRDEAPGNRNNLPETPDHRKEVIGEKLRSLMDASAQYAFSEDRMRDNTHFSPDNRGVDRTSLFEGLVTVCSRAAIALQDFDFLFEDLFQRYDDAGISSIYLRQLEPFILDTKIKFVPPRITQRLIGLHAEGGRPDYVERIIWHIDPSCLDISQTIQLCQQHHLYDALIYIYTRAIRDYVTPVVELLELIRKVKRYRKSRYDLLQKTGENTSAKLSMESTIIHAYKIYPYLANILSGLTYPSEEPLTEEDAIQAKKAVYKFLFFGRSSMWPPGEGGKLVLTSDEDGGVEPTYPYVRQLLLFDSESFLHSLDIAFEDVYLNESETISRSMIVRILLEISTSSQMPQEDVTMVNIFVARNIPKYPQFLESTPTTLHNILVGLAEDCDPKSLEDRQLAAEYLLSVYTPHDSERIIYLFNNAGFFRILRSWYYHDQAWSKLLSTYIDHSDSASFDILQKVEEVLTFAARSNKGVIPEDLIKIVSGTLPFLLHMDTAGTARLVDKMAPELHEPALKSFEGDAAADAYRYQYLCALLSPPSDDDEPRIKSPQGPSMHLSSPIYRMFVSLQCRFEPENIISTLQVLPKDYLDADDVLGVCEVYKVYDAVVWATDWLGDPQGAMRKAEVFQKQLSRSLLAKIGDFSDATAELDALRRMANIARSICLAHSQKSSTIDIPLEDMWFMLLNSQIQTVQTIAAFQPMGEQNIPPRENERLQEVETSALSNLRSLVQATFGALVSITSTSTVSFPRLFKRLVNSTPSSTGSHYTEFRTILTGMLESYRSDEDLLGMLKHLIERDLFEAVEQAAKEHLHGWGPIRSMCQYCRKPVIITSESKVTTPASSQRSIVVGRTGNIFHTNCKPSIDTPI